jgi:hypothetical protein
MTTATDIEFELSPYPHAGTVATKMLAEAFHKIWNTRHLSQRQLAARLGYRSSVPLSHMAAGRVPIPISRVTDLSRALEIDEAALLLAVLEQRHPDIEFKRILQTVS